jgi:hypothetical protein
MSPFDATAMWRTCASESATSVMQNPAGTLIPPLVLLHAWPDAGAGAAAVAVMESRTMAGKAAARRMNM